MENLIIHQAPFHNRANFGKYLNQQNLTGLAAEIGTHRGTFAKMLLDQWAGNTLYCIDPWKGGYYPGDPASESDRTVDYEAAVAVLRPHSNRVEIVQATSQEASKRFPDNGLDFVYIDANHSYEHVLEDLRLWWPRIKQGGIIAGHDFVCPGERLGGWGRFIQPAVMFFANTKQATIHIVVEINGGPWSYYLIKGDA